MKKTFKIVIIVVIVLAILLGILVGWDFFEGFFKRNKLNNERINNSTTLSNYIKYHDWEHTQYSDDLLALYGNMEDIKCDILKDKDVLYYYDGIMILDDYSIYETAFSSDKTYSNGQQCKQIQTDIKIDRLQLHYMQLFLISEDGKYYIIDKNTKKLIEVSTDFYEEKYISKFTQQTLSNKDIVKTSNNFDNFAVLKTDGQVYLQKYNAISHVLESETLLISSEKYGKVLDFEYSNEISNLNSDTQLDSYEITLLITEKGLYYLKTTNNQEYIDSTPNYELVSSDIYSKYKDDIKYINNIYVITKDNYIIRTYELCNDIDKEVK